jgi:hypothetical protein
MEVILCLGIAVAAVSIGTGALASKIHREYSYYGDKIPGKFVILNDSKSDNFNYEVMVKNAIKTGNNEFFKWALSYPRNIHTKEILDELKRQRGV